MEKDNSVELKELKNEALEPEDQVDKSAPKEEHVVLVDNEDDDNESKSSTESSAEETCNKMWEQAFEKLARADGENDGKIEVKSLVKWIKSLDLNSRVEYEKHLDISPNQIERIVNKADHNKDGQIDKEEFLNLVKNENDLFTKRQESVFKQYIQVVAYGEEYRCRPPPLAILSFTLIEILLYIIDRAALGNITDDYKCSYLYYNPFKRYEVWRYMTYMFVHTSNAHLIGNMVMQLLVGIPLEMSHGAWRVTVVYCFGVMAGSLASSVFDPKMYLGGASGGVYALVASHLATLLMNWKEDSVIIAHRVRRQRKRTATKHHGKIVRLMRLGIVILYAIIDFVVAIYKRESSMQTNVSFVAHLGGVVAGFLVGIVILRNRKVEAWETRLKKLCFVIFGILMGLFTLWNLAGEAISPTFFPSGEKVKCEKVVI